MALIDYDSSDEDEEVQHNENPDEVRTALTDFNMSCFADIRLTYFVECRRYSTRTSFRVSTRS